MNHPNLHESNISPSLVFWGVQVWYHTITHLKWLWAVQFSAHLNLVKLHTNKYKMPTYRQHTRISYEVSFVVEQALFNRPVSLDISLVLPNGSACWNLNPQSSIWSWSSLRGGCLIQCTGPVRSDWQYKAGCLLLGACMMRKIKIPHFQCFPCITCIKGVLHPWALYLKTLCIFSKNKAILDKVSYGSGQKCSKVPKNHSFTSAKTNVVKLG